MGKASAAADKLAEVTFKQGAGQETLAVGRSPTNDGNWILSSTRPAPGKECPPQERWAKFEAEVAEYVIQDGADENVAKFALNNVELVDKPLRFQDPAINVQVTDSLVKEMRSTPLRLRSR